MTKIFNSYNFICTNFLSLIEIAIEIRALDCQLPKYLLLVLLNDICK